MAGGLGGAVVVGVAGTVVAGVAETAVVGVARTVVAGGRDGGGRWFLTRQEPKPT